MTDKEIFTVWNEFERTSNLPIIDFARALLEKAEEETAQLVLANNCTCYKLGYSRLNNYEKV
jgi:hypothetical protein